MNISAIAGSGLQQAQADIEHVAKHVAGPDLPVDAVAISQEAVALMVAKTRFDAQIKALEVAFELEKTALTVAPTGTP